MHLEFIDNLIIYSVRIARTNRDFFFSFPGECIPSFI